MKPDRKPDGFFASAAKYTSIAITLPAAVFGGYAIGYGLDFWLGTTYLKIVFLLLGIASGFLALIRQITLDAKKLDAKADSTSSDTKSK